MSRGAHSVLVTVVGAVVLALAIAACGEDGDSGHDAASANGEVAEDAGADSNEHGGEAGEHDESESDNDAGEESGTQYSLDDTYDQTRAGTRLVLAYDRFANAFTGTVENVAYNVLTRVRVEVHLSNGVELGPTTLTDLSPGQVINVLLPATEAAFETWSAHPEVGGVASADDENAEPDEQQGSDSGEHDGDSSEEHESESGGG